MIRTIHVPEYNLSDFRLPHLNPREIKTDLLTALHAISEGSKDLVASWSKYDKEDKKIPTWKIELRIDQDALYIRAAVALAVSAIAASRSKTELRTNIERQLKTIDAYMVSFNRKTSHPDPDWNPFLDFENAPENYAKYLEVHVPLFAKKIEELRRDIVSFTGRMKDPYPPPTETQFIVPERTKLEPDPIRISLPEPTFGWDEFTGY
jgi:hypothetical protein